MIKIRTLLLASAVALSAMPAFAHEAKDCQGMDMNMSGMDNMVGMHEMSVVVKAIDLKTGLVDVDAGGMALKVHFPPSTLKEVKTGDKITLHLGFAKS
jgi:hypothetical protein